LDEDAMASEDSWAQVVKKLQAGLTKAWDDSEAAAASKKAITVREAEKLAAAKESERLAVVAEARKAVWVNVSDALVLIQHELDVTQFDAQETLIVACASREVWFRFVRPNGLEIALGFLDPRWWQSKLGGLIIHGGASQQTILEVTASELAYFLIDVEQLLAWLTDRGWPTKRGQIQWNYLIGDYISKSWNELTDPRVRTMEQQDRSDELRMASASMIDTEISDAYSAAERAGQKPPNIKEIAKVVQDGLREKGYQASVPKIQKLADAEKHKKRRRKPGPTMASEKRRPRGQISGR
jgi:hypothetical protein